MKITKTIIAILMVAAIFFFIGKSCESKRHENKETKDRIKANERAKETISDTIKQNTAKVTDTLQKAVKSSEKHVTENRKEVKAFQDKIKKPVQDATYLEKCNYLLYEYGMD